MDDTSVNAADAPKPPRLRRAFLPLAAAGLIALFAHQPVQVATLFFVVTFMAFFLSLSQAALAWSLGVVIDEFGMFAGSPIMQLRLGKTVVNLNQIPSSTCYLKFRPLPQGDLGPAVPGTFEALALPATLLVIWEPILVMLVLGACLLGVRQTEH